MKRTFNLLLGAALLLPVFVPMPAVAAAPERMRAQEDVSVPGHVLPLVDIPEPKTGEPYVGTPPVRPRAGLSSTTTLVAGQPSTAAGLPVTLQSDTAGRVTLEVVDSPGLTFHIASENSVNGDPAVPAATVSVDYTAFRDTYGADWADRLVLARAGDCAGCAAAPLPSTNEDGTVSAQVALPATLTVQAGPAGPSGDYSATSLQPSATWSAGNSSGDFSWNYPFRVPPAVGGPSPSLALAYSSSSVDGRMAASNNQPSWAGEGFEVSTGYIERRYKMCSEDTEGTANNANRKTGDQCWVTDNATLSLNGRGGDLVFESGKGWRNRSDDASRIERRTGAANGDDDGEHWVVTTSDGVQYWFGKSGATESVLTTPVYGNHPQEPCHETAFADSDCTQAYRWNLDYVVDPSGNTMTYTYKREKNKYARNITTTDLAEYDRASYLVRIDYGTRDGSANVPARVLFETADRCLANCTTKNATTWPDTPFDQECSTSPCQQTAPTFWTTRRLAKIVTQVWNATTGKHDDVESWTFTHSFPDPGDGTRPGLWLDKISHAGRDGVTVPDVMFQGVQMPNRVDTIDHSPAMNWWRIASVTTETGGKLGVSYSAPDCVAGTRVPSAPESNTLRCYPVKWRPPGAADPLTDYFHKYVVTAVTENDLTTHAPRTITRYDYLGDPGWHYTDDDGMVKADYKTWSVWRGYGTVRTTKGDPGQEEITETTYFRGMHGDKLPSGTRTATMPAVGGAPAVNDEDAYAGMTRRTVTYNGAAAIGTQTFEPWQSAPTATRTLNGVTVSARHTGTAVTRTGTVLDGGRAPRTTSARTTFDEYGLVTQVNEAGDEAVTGDEKCVKTTYEPRDGRWLLALAKRVETYSVPCATAPAVADDVISDVFNTYDDKGRVTKVETLTSWSAKTYTTTARTGYDAQGRIIDAWDSKGGHSTTVHTPVTGGPLTKTVQTNVKGWTTTTEHDPAWGASTRITDQNGRVTVMRYDGLGRLSKVWAPGREGEPTPTAQFGYLVRNDGPVVVTTSRLNANGGLTTSHTLYDGLLRVRQSQAPEAGDQGGRVVTDSFYDTAGRMWQTNDAYVADGAPGTSLYEPLGDHVIPSQTRKLYDGAGRETASIFYSKNVEKWRTTTATFGDRIETTPPEGGTPSTMFTDVSGRTTRLRLAGDDTRYEYNKRGELKKITDPAGSVWEYQYDLRGNKIVEKDPDKGTTTSSYNEHNELTRITDTTGASLTFAYDELGRKKSVSAGAVKRAEWFYDTLLPGQLDKSVRYEGGNAYTREITEYTVGYKPKSEIFTIPSSEGALAGSYTYTHTYTANGLPASTRLPDVDGAGTGLAAETLATGYTDLDKPATLSGYVDLTDYTRYGELAVVGRRNGTGQIMDTGYFYQEGTRRLERLRTTREVAPSTVQDVTFGFDNVGNLTKAAASDDTQCFRYDTQRRLTQAWTPDNGDCAPDPAAAALGGAAKYWLSWQYDEAGNRLEQVARTTGSTVSTTYAYSATQPHALTGATTDGTTTTYGYDPTGNTVTRPSANGTQTLTWDGEGRLAASTDTSGSTSFVYDADGQRLLRRDPAGATLYLPGQELRVTGGTGGTKATTRYYTHAGVTVGFRTSAEVTGLTWLAGDHQGTSQVSVRASDQALTVRRQTPYGTSRTGSGTWPTGMTKGFVGGVNDNTGLVHLGAREYDAALGRFISVDPVIDYMDPQQMQGYSYAGSNPMTMADADGRWPKPPAWLSKAGSALKQVADNHVQAAAKAISTVKSSAVAAYNNTKSGLKSAGTWLVDHAGDISALTGTASLLLAMGPPPLQVAAAALGAVSFAFGVVDAVKQCADRKPIDCSVATVSLIPGLAGLKSGVKAAKASLNFLKARKALNAADIDARHAAGASDMLYSQPTPSTTNPNYKDLTADRTKAMDDLYAANERQAMAKRQYDEWNKRLYAPDPWRNTQIMVTVYNQSYTTCKAMRTCPQDQQDFYQPMLNTIGKRQGGTFVE
ncbi:type IV secretion protein Rhs [Acrocarpospora phusangensis]|uniref:Type IV secretion protein Rhs n=1 Tax=Acrocarpospora phusangensis TaxID=1070424 RepID=A0A919Q5N1_9ACTN|nr:RHS repeat-associated core domain-containing protein [Acrocarpospora phusangensis]GIH22829.1 type IV secretion protein Rhs [Acrocarpospora phusangensis]